MPRGWARGQILVHIKNMVILLNSFHIKIPSRQKAFILGRDVHRMLTFILWHLTPVSVHARGWDIVYKNNNMLIIYFVFFLFFVFTSLSPM